jgi:diguanylate cyclase (GGDEF)-like protein
MENNDQYRILVVDDETANLAVLNKILSPEYVVFTAKSGGEGLRRVAEDKPDLILLDIIMPDINGFELLKTLKANPDTRQIPVIIITGLDNEVDEERGFVLGAVDYITKPFKNTIVAARVRTHIQIVRHLRVIERLGMVDPLTDISNRRCFDDRLTMEWRRALRDQKPISFMMIDVDKFKTYNDTYGHPQGDTLLRTIARIFAAAARRSGDISARLGGEEFGVLLPDTELHAAAKLAEEIRSRVETERIPTVDGKIQTCITVSIGVASTVPTKDSSPETFISRADTLLYQAKEKGRNRICFDESP